MTNYLPGIGYIVRLDEGLVPDLPGIHPLCGRHHGPALALVEERDGRPMPNDLELIRTCETGPACVNPAHHITVKVPRAMSRSHRTLS